MQESPPLPQQLWSHERTAAFFGVSPWTLHKWNSNKTGPPSYKIGRYRKYDPQAVAAWMHTRRSA